MPFFYDLATGAYHLGIRLAAPFSTKARKWVQGRTEVWTRLERFAPELNGCLWMHCASLGEFEQGRPVLEALKEAQPKLPILITFFSPSGYEVRKGFPVADHVEYLPADGKANAERLLRIVRPSMAVFVKYEFWYHYLHSLRSHQVPTFLISAIFRKEQPFFQFWGGTHRAMLRCFDHIFVQNEGSAQLLSSIGLNEVSVAGDTRFDRVVQIAEQAKEIPLAKAFKRASELPLLIAGSTWPKDEELLVEAAGSTTFRLLLAPHEVNDRRVHDLLKVLPRPADKWSHLQAMLKGLFNPPHSGLPQPPDQPNGDPLELRAIIVDQIGILGQLYQYGDIAYVGGGFGSGIHNLLEAAVWGIPVIFGPKHEKFAEAQGLIDAGGGFVVTDMLAMMAIMQHLIGDPIARKNAGEAAKNYVLSNAGATDRIIAQIYNAAR